VSGRGETEIAAEEIDWIASDFDNARGSRQGFS